MFAKQKKIMYGVDLLLVLSPIKHLKVKPAWGWGSETQDSDHTQEARMINLEDSFYMER